MNNIIREQLQKMGDIKSISQLMEEEARMQNNTLQVKKKR